MPNSPIGNTDLKIYFDGNGNKIVSTGPEINICGKVINDAYRYANPYTHFLEYEKWSNQNGQMPHPKLPLNMLQSMDYSGEEFFYHVKNTLKKHGLEGLQFKMLEVGGRSEGSYTQDEGFWGLEFHNLNLENPHNCSRTVIGDITNCPEIPDNSYDFVYSMDTFEHIAEPWKAAKEIVRILKPGGITFIVTLFAWRYHPAPIDYWRFSPHCLAFLFKDLELIEANWDIRNRRVPHQGTIEENDVCPEDHFGPFLENFRVYFIGKKNGKI